MLNLIKSTLMPSLKTFPMPKISTEPQISTDSEEEFDINSDSSALDGFSSDDDDSPQRTEVTSRVHGVPDICRVNEFGPINLSNVVDERSERLMILNLGNNDIDPELYTTVKEEHVGKAEVSKNSNTFLEIEELQAYRQRTQTHFDNNDINVFTKDKKCFSISDYTLGNDTNGTAILSFETEAGKQKTLTNEAIHCISLSRLPNMLALSCDSNGDNVYVSRRTNRNGLIWEEATYLKVEDLTRFPETVRPSYTLPTYPSLQPPSVPSLPYQHPIPSTIGAIQSLNPVYIVAETIITEQSRGEIKGPLTLSWQSPSEGEDWRLEIKNDDGFNGVMTWKRENAQDTSSFTSNIGMTLTIPNRLEIIQALAPTIQEIPFKRLDVPTQKAVRRLLFTMAIIDTESEEASPITNLGSDVTGLL